MNKIKIDTYKKLITFFKFRTDDYELWGEMLHYLDSDAIDEAVDQWIRTKAKAPTVADIATLAEELEIKRRIEKKENDLGQEQKEDANRRLYEESIKASEKNYVIMCEYVNEDKKAFRYFWQHAESLHNFNTRRIRRFYNGNEYFLYFLDEN